MFSNEMFKTVFNNSNVDPNKIKDLKNITTIKKDGKSKEVRKAPTLNKFPEKVVEVNGKKSYGVGESNQDKADFGEKNGITHSEMTTDEIKFVKLYSGEGFEYLNIYLRKKVALNTHNDINELYIELSKKWDSVFKDDENYMTLGHAIKVGAGLFKKGKILEEDLVVVRRQKSPMNKHAENGIYTNEGFLSTSISIKITKYGEYVNLIRIPKGEKILYIEKVTGAEREYEVLLPPGTVINLLEERSKKLHTWTL